MTQRKVIKEPRYVTIVDTGTGNILCKIMQRVRLLWIRSLSFVSDSWFPLPHLDQPSCSTIHAELNRPHKRPKKNNRKNRSRHQVWILKLLRNPLVGAETNRNIQPAQSCGERKTSWKSVLWPKALAPRPGWLEEILYIPYILTCIYAIYTCIYKYMYTWLYL